MTPHFKVRRIFLLCGIIFFAISSPAQPNVIDSLSKLLKTAKADTNKIILMMNLGNQYQNINPDTAMYFHKQCIVLSEQLNNPFRKCKAMVMTASDYMMKDDFPAAIKLFDETLILAKKLNAKQVEAKIYMDLALIYKHQTNFPKAIEYHQKSASIFEEIGMKMGVVANLGNIGSIYNAQSNFPKALESYSKVLKMQEEAGDKNQMGITYGNIANVYRAQGNYSKAIDFIFKALKTDEASGNKAGVARHYGNMGSIYSDQGDNVKALDYYMKSLKMNEELGYKSGIASNLGNIGLIYSAKRDIPTALDYCLRALKINEALGDQHETLINLNNLGSLYAEQGDAEKALATQLRVIKLAEQLDLKSVLASALGNVGSHYIKSKQFVPAETYLQRSLSINTEIGSLKELRDVNKLLYTLHTATNKHKEALEDYKNYILYRDSILNKENTKRQVEEEMQYAFDKKQALAGAEQAKKDALSKEELDKQRLQRNAFIIGFALMLTLAMVIYRSFRTKSKANAIISKQKEEVERQKEITENQKMLVEEKNKEILDSITYAKRLQLAMLPPEKFVKGLLPDSFILFKPKDIVAGDFYWFETVFSKEKNNDVILLAAADCTGHGVPGAMVSVVCSNALNRTVKEFGITEPGKILDKVRDLVVETFEKSESEVKDGMDIALCSLSLSTLTLEYSGANNPLWISRKNKEDGQFELIEIRADKQPIGKHPDSKPFTTTTIKLEKGDTLYIFTDGYNDQFGGEYGKKLKSANSKKLLLAIQEKSMDEQFTLIDQYFENWKGNLEQVDDVCLIGIRI